MDQLLIISPYKQTQPNESPGNRVTFGLINSHRDRCPRSAKRRMDIHGTSNTDVKLQQGWHVQLNPLNIFYSARHQVTSDDSVEEGTRQLEPLISDFGALSHNKRGNSFRVSLASRLVRIAHGLYSISGSPNTSHTSEGAWFWLAIGVRTGWSEFGTHTEPCSRGKSDLFLMALFAIDFQPLQSNFPGKQ